MKQPPRPATGFSRLGTQLLPSGKQLLRSGKQLLRSGKQLLQSGKQLLRSGEQLLRSRKQLLKSGEQLLKSGKQLLTCIKIAKTRGKGVKMTRNRTKTRFCYVAKRIGGVSIPVNRIIEVVKLKMMSRHHASWFLA